MASTCRIALVMAVLLLVVFYSLASKDTCEDADSEDADSEDKCKCTCTPTWKTYGIVAGLFVGGGTVVVFGGQAILAAIGFGPGGVVAGSIAAAIQAKIGVVAAGSVFAALQSLGASGFGLLSFFGAGTATALVGSTAAGVLEDEFGYDCICR